MKTEHYAYVASENQAYQFRESSRPLHLLGVDCMTKSRNGCCSDKANDILMDWKANKNSVSFSKEQHVLFFSS